MANNIEPIKESEEEAKLLKEVFYAAKLDENQVDVLIIKFEFWKQSGYYLGLTDFHTILNQGRDNWDH